MTSIPFLIGRNSCNQFKSKCLKFKKFLQTFNVLLKLTYNFEHFNKKDDLHTLSVSQIVVSERRGDLNP